MADNWFTYDWHMEDDPAVFAVDTRFAQKAPYPNRPVLMHLRCEMQKGGPFTAAGKWRLNRIEHKCHDLKALYVGRIQDSGRRVMFFYTDHPRRAQALEDIADRETILCCQTGCSQDRNWDTYFNLLYPDAAKLQTESNRTVIDQYRRHGDHSPAARRVTFHMFFPTENLALQFAAEARLSSFAIGDSEYNPDFEEPHGIKLHRICTLDKADMDRNTSAAIYIAQRYMGKLLYWESPIIPKSSPLK